MTGAIGRMPAPAAAPAANIIVSLGNGGNRPDPAIVAVMIR